MQQIKISSSNMLMDAIQMNYLIGNEVEESAVVSSSEDLDLEEDDG
jgi:hypothetical protein